MEFLKYLDSFYAIIHTLDEPIQTFLRENLL